MKEVIKIGKRNYGIIYRGDWKEGSTWISFNEDPIQVGLFFYNKGQHLRSHTHKIYDRTANRTCETMYVIAGKARIKILNEKEKVIATRTLKTNDIYVSLWGGHSFDVLEHGTRIFEAKNGPYFGVEKDKIFYE